MKLRHLLVGFIDEFVPWMSCDMIERTRKAKVQAIFKSLRQRLEVHQNVQCPFIGIIILAIYANGPRNGPAAFWVFLPSI